MARPSKYTQEFATQAAKLCQLGATDRDLADFFAVGIRTISYWQAAYPEFRQALKVGKAEADDRVERSLYQRANGYTFRAVKIMQDKGRELIVPYTEHLPPDVTACIFWLKNRRPQQWRDVSEQKHTGTVQVEHSQSRELVARELSRIAARSGAGSDTGETDGQAVH